jgi:two-component system cell cycle sensor histidine kinase/response regulator CckA
MVAMVTDPFRASVERQVKTTLEILLAQDDAAYAATLCDALRQQAGGASVAITTVGHLSAAVEQARSPRWDAVVLDLSLPDSRGVTTLTTLVAAAPHLPIVVLASADDEPGAGVAVGHGAQECLLKDAATSASLYRVILQAMARHAYTDRFRTAEARYPDLKSAMQRLRASDERFRLIADNTREAFVILELPSGQPLYLSRMWEEISGRPARDPSAPPSLWLDAVEPEDRGTVAAAFEAARRGDPAESVFRLRRPDDSVRWLRARTFPVRDDRGRVHRMVGLVEDITQLRQTEDQLRQAQKMEAIGQLAGGIAHDFNNLLVVMGGYADLVGDALGLSHPLRRDVDAIRAAAQSAEGLTRQLLAVSRRQILQPQVLDLNQALQRVEQLLRRVIGEDIDLVMILADPLRRVCADPGQIEQVILNLAVNARDAMPAGGRLTIETADVDFDAANVAQHPGAVTGPHVMLAVSDTGCGMDETTLKRLFEPFFTTKPPGRGTGLGLATVYGIVKQSQGTIEVHSELGRGATFRMHLPAATCPLDVASGSELDAQAFRGDETILVLEDHAEVRAVIVDTLRRHGYAVTGARTSAEALTIALDRSRRLDLLLTDLVLPDENGREVAGRILAERPGTPVLYMSGYTEPSVIGNVLDRAGSFIQKPFNPGTLLKSVRAVLDGAVREEHA